MQIFLLLAGLILLIAGGSWFAGATAVGWVCIAVFAVLTVIQLLAVAGFRKAVKHFDKNW